jgi:hypothetical protein
MFRPGGQSLEGQLLEVKVKAKNLHLLVIGYKSQQSNSTL